MGGAEGKRSWSGAVNILWIITTQWRASACGYAGSADVTTPVLDALAGRSIDFTQAVTPHPFGPFARAALLTGIESPQNGVCDYFDPLPSGCRTVADGLNDRGYATAFFGKWHLAKRDPAAPLVGETHARMWVPPQARGGFKFWEGFESGFQLNDPWLHGTRLPTAVQVSGYQSDVLCQRAGAWVAEAPPTQPWFCVVSLEPPHPPYDQAPQGKVYASSSLRLSPNVPKGGTVETRVRQELAGYYAHISATDRAIGELLSCIDRETTTVVFTSVHGDMHGAHGLFRKGWPYEESIRVPLLVNLPGAEATKSLAAVSLSQLPMWTLSLADHGKIPPLQEKWARISMPSVVALPDQCDRIWRGARSAKKKWVLNDDGSPWLFFDLEQDPQEMTNLVNDPRSADALRAVIQESRLDF